MNAALFPEADRAQPERIVALYKGLGFVEAKRTQERVVLHKPGLVGTLTVPLDLTFADFRQRMVEHIAGLAMLSGRSFLQVLAEVTQP